MKPSARSGPRNRLQPSVKPEAVEDVGVEEVVANVGVEDEVLETKVKEVNLVSQMIKLMVKERILILVIKLNVILTHLHLNHVFVTGPLGKVLIFVWSQPHVLGRISSCQSQINETVTSSAKIVTQRKSSLCCIQTSYQKYTP